MDAQIKKQKELKTVLREKRHEFIQNQVPILSFLLYYGEIMQKTFREVIEGQISIKYLLVILAFILFFVGYGLWTMTNTGTLTIDSPVYGTRVMIDERPVGILNDAKDTLRLSERTGKHTVLISKNEYWPWMRDIEIKKHETMELHPFIIPQNVPVESVSRFLTSEGTTVDTNYMKIAALFENRIISDEIKPFILATRIKGVTYADFFPGRTDVILVETPDGIFAVETEKSEHPNFQPVYKKANATFVKNKDNVFYIKNGDSILRVKDLGK